MKEIRVLHIYRTYFPETQGGLQEAIRQFCLATQPMAVENTIFALARHPEPHLLQRPEGKLVRARSWFEIASCDFGGWSAFRRCREAARQADIIQVHHPWPFADMLLPFIVKPQQPVVVTYVSDIVRQRGLSRLYAPLQRYLLGKATRIIATSPNYARSSPVLRRYSEKLTYIPHCLNKGNPPSELLLRYWAERLGKGFFLFVGVLRYYKGLDFLIAAARQVNAPIVIVGDGPEGPRLRLLAQDLQNVIFLGALPDADKLALMALCRAVVFPSHLRSEAFGITLLEGARAGKPLISCEIGSGTTWVNLHQETGLVVPPCNSEALAQSMNLLDSDLALCTRLGAGAKSRWEAHFSSQIVGQAYRQLYEEILR